MPGNTPEAKQRSGSSRPRIRHRRSRSGGRSRSDGLNRRPVRSMPSRYGPTWALPAGSGGVHRRDATEMWQTGVSAASRTNRMPPATGVYGTVPALSPLSLSRSIRKSGPAGIFNMI